MGRHGPLTSLALGRSPYDEVVQGEGVDDPRAPEQEYDERGRPVNLQTKRINKDIVRSHNEVMLVIGVAEPENSAPDPQLAISRRHNRHERVVAGNLRPVVELVEIACAWGVNGLRHRIQLYKRYSDIPFHRLFGYHLTQQSIGSYFLSGLPAYMVNYSFKFAADELPLLLPALRLRRKPWFQFACIYGIMHMDLYSMMQRAGLIASSGWFPDWKFFVPGSALSPIALDPLPSTLAAGSILQWSGRIAVGVAPFVAFYLRQQLYAFLYNWAWTTVANMIPRPIGRDMPGHVSQVNLCPDCGIPESVPGLTSRVRVNGQHSHSNQQLQDSPRQSDDGQSGPPMRNHSGTASVREDDFGSDDEESGPVSGALISFDVEATDRNDTAPGWCAELRPNVDQETIVANQDPRYRSNSLTTLPADLATDIVASLVPRVLTEPFQQWIWCSIARSILVRQGLPVDGIRGSSAFSWGAWRNLLGLHVFHLFLQADAWFAMYHVVQHLTVTQEEWELLEATEATEATEVTEVTEVTND